MTNKQRAEYKTWNKTRLITEINRLMRENEKARADERAKAVEDCKSIIMQTIDNELLVDTLFLRMDELKEQK